MGSGQLPPCRKLDGCFAGSAGTLAECLHFRGMGGIETNNIYLVVITSRLGGIGKLYIPTAPVDTSTGKRPVLREIITSTDSRYGKVVEGEERWSEEASVAHENLTHVNRSRFLTVEKQVLEDKTLKEKTPVSQSRYKLFLIGGAVGIILSLLFYLL